MPDEEPARITHEKKRRRPFVGGAFLCSELKLFIETRREKILRTRQIARSEGRLINYASICLDKTRPSDAVFFRT
jgi:hypothetical protein